MAFGQSETVFGARGERVVGFNQVERGRVQGLESLVVGLHPLGPLERSVPSTKPSTGAAPSRLPKGGCADPGASRSAGSNLDDRASAWRRGSDDAFHLPIGRALQVLFTAPRKWAAKRRSASRGGRDGPKQRPLPNPDQTKAEHSRSEQREGRRFRQGATRPMPGEQPGLVPRAPRGHI